MWKIPDDTNNKALKQEQFKMVRIVKDCADQLQTIYKIEKFRLNLYANLSQGSFDSGCNGRRRTFSHVGHLVYNKYNQIKRFKIDCYVVG